VGGWCERIWDGVVLRSMTIRGGGLVWRYFWLESVNYGK
jgi:hypothetical protein